jgi:hypothetical protein
MKRFKQFLEENLISKKTLLEYRPPNPPDSYVPEPGSSNSDNYWPGYVNPPTTWEDFLRPHRNPGVLERSPFFLYDNDGNIIGTDLNGDGQVDTQEEIQQWIESGGLERIPSDWYADQNFFMRYLIAWWNVGQWILPFGTIGRATSLFLRILYEIVQHGSIILDFLDLDDIVTFILENQDIFPELYQALQELIQYIGQDAFNDLLQYFTPSTTENVPSIPKQFYRHIPGSNPGGMWQLYRFNPTTGTWEPYGPPITLDEYSNMCEQEGSNCAPLENPANPFPFKPPLTITPQNYEVEPFDPSEIPSYRPLPTNQHWNQQLPGGNGIDPDPNPFPWPQM